MSAIKTLLDRAQGIEGELEEISIDDPRSPLEIALDLDDAETMATRASHYPP